MPAVVREPIRVALSLQAYGWVTAPSGAPFERKAMAMREANEADVGRRARYERKDGNGRGGTSAVALAAGAIVAMEGLARRSLAGLLISGIGGALLLRGIGARPDVLGRLGGAQDPDDVEEQIGERGIEVTQAFLINADPKDLYTHWRNFQNLPAIMTYLERVDVVDDRRSHWVAKAPLLVGGSVEWDAEITRDEPGRAIAWRSLPGSQVATVGDIRFERALGDRGTEVHVKLSYLPPAGQVGHWLATVFGKAPRRTIREDLRNFKRIMEVGEIPTTQNQSRGTCLGSTKSEGEER